MKKAFYIEPAGNGFDINVEDWVLKMIDGLRGRHSRPITTQEPVALTPLQREIVPGICSLWNIFAAKYGKTKVKCPSNVVRDNIIKIGLGEDWRDVTIATLRACAADKYIMGKTHHGFNLTLAWLTRPEKWSDFASQMPPQHSVGRIGSLNPNEEE